MQFEPTKQVAAGLVQVYTSLNEILWIVKENADQEEFSRYRQTIAELMATISLELLNPVFKQHPELAPPELRDMYPGGTDKGQEEKD